MYRLVTNITLVLVDIIVDPQGRLERQEILYVRTWHHLQL